jgi:hypothetical protein
LGNLEGLTAFLDDKKISQVTVVSEYALKRLSQKVDLSFVTGA